MLVGFAISMSVASILFRPDGEEFVELNDVIWILSISMLVFAPTIKILHRHRASSKEGDAREQLLFSSRLVPIAMLEASCLLSAVAYYIGAPDIPALAMIGLTTFFMILLIPYFDPKNAMRDTLE